MLPEWTTALPDWEERIRQPGSSLLPCGPLFPASAAGALSVFKGLRIVDIAGRPTFGECALPWVLNFAETFFGSYNPEDGKRLISNYLLLVAKKNSKSTLAAGLMVTALLRNWRDSAEYLILAPTIEIANNSFKPARDMAKADPQLVDLLHVQDNIRTITHRKTGATLKVVAADAGTVGGKKATGVLVDELWQFGAVHNADDMLLEATGGLASRDEGFVIYISTHSSEPPAGVFKSKLEYFRKVRDGKIHDPASLGVLYEFPESMIKDKTCFDPANWAISNPNLGKSVRPDYIQRKIDEARQSGDESVRITIAKHLNIPVDMASRGDRWAGADYWRACADKTLTIETLIARCDVIGIGIDGGGMDDLLGLCLMGRERGTRRLLAVCRAWAHQRVLERRKEIAPRLLDFVKEGSVWVIPDESTADVHAVADIVEQIEAAALLPAVGAIGVDPAGVLQLVNELERRGFSSETGDGKGRIRAITQGWKLTTMIKTCELALAQRELVHDGSDLMMWCVSNAKVEPRGNAVTITKAVAGSAKIDPLMAMFNAADIMATNPQAKASGKMSDFLSSPLLVA